MIAIGIDPGVNTGLARWCSVSFVLQVVETMSIIQAMHMVLDNWLRAKQRGEDFIVIVEDARKRKGRFTIADDHEEKYGAGVREGVGSVKRDSSIWESFLQYHGIPYEMRIPRGTKMSPEQFSRLTGWVGRCSKHARDAAMIVFQLNSPILSLKLQTFKESREPGRESSLPAGARLRSRSRRRSR